MTKLAPALAVGGTTISISPGIGVLLEAILTFFLANAVLNGAVSGKGGPAR